MKTENIKIKANSNYK